MRPIGIIVNGAMLAGTPIQGGHYFIDLIGGIAVMLLALMAARMVSRAVERRIDAADGIAPQSATLADIRDAPSLIAPEPGLPRQDHAPAGLTLDHAGRVA
jgi:hypothetical protein